MDENGIIPDELDAACRQHDLRTRHLVERAERLIQQQDLGFAGEAARQCRALRQAAGQLIRKMPPRMRKSDLFDRRIDAGAAFRTRQARLVFEIETEGNLPFLREPRENARILKRDRDARVDAM